MSNHSDSFRRDGFVRIQQFLSADEVADMRANLDRVIAETVPGLPRECAFYEDRDDASTLKQIQHLEEHDGYFQTWFAGRFADLAGDLLGDAVGKNFQYFNKPPEIGKPTPPHQDGYYFMIEPCEAVTMWLALEDVDEENGCLRYIHGSHAGGMRPHGRTKTLGFSQGIQDFSPEDHSDDVIVCPAKAGDLFAHHALTIHWADANRSATRSRRAVGAVYFSALAKPNEEAQAAYQKKLSEELVEAGKL